MGIFNNIKQAARNTLAKLSSVPDYAEPITYNDPQWKRTTTTTASRRAERQRLDSSRYLHVSCPPNHNRLNKALGISKGVTHLKPLGKIAN